MGSGLAFGALLDFPELKVDSVGVGTWDGACNVEAEAKVGAIERGVSGTVVEGVAEPRLSPTAGSVTSCFLSSRSALFRANRLLRLFLDDCRFAGSGCNGMLCD